MFSILDKEILLFLHTKPDKCLDLLMDKYISLVHTIVNNQLGSKFSKEDKEECISDVFLEIFRIKDKINFDKESIKSFIAVIAKRRAIDFYRKEKSRIEKDLHLDEYTINLIDQNNSNNTIDKNVDNKILIETIKSLGEPDCEIILRKYYFGQTSKEISLILGIKQNTIDKKVSRALEKLKDILGGVV